MLNTIDSDEDENNFFEQLSRKAKKKYGGEKFKRTEMIKDKGKFGF